MLPPPATALVKKPGQQVTGLTMKTCPGFLTGRWWTGRLRVANLAGLGRKPGLFRMR